MNHCFTRNPVAVIFGLCYVWQHSSLKKIKNCHSLSVYMLRVSMHWCSYCNTRWTTYKGHINYQHIRLLQCEDLCLFFFVALNDKSSEVPRRAVSFIASSKTQNTYELLVHLVFWWWVWTDYIVHVFFFIFVLSQTRAISEYYGKRENSYHVGTHAQMVEHGTHAHSNANFPRSSPALEPYIANVLKYCTQCIMVALLAKPYRTYR